MIRIYTIFRSFVFNLNGEFMMKSKLFKDFGKKLFFENLMLTWFSLTTMVYRWRSKG